MTLGVMTEAQCAEFDELHEARVIQEMCGAHLSKHQQTYICFCGDGKHAIDLTRFHADMVGVDPDSGLFHKIALNGGALVMSPSNALAKLDGLPQDLVMIMNLERGLELKGNSGQIALYIHAPCGAAGLAGITSLADMIDEGLRAKFRIRTIFPESLFHGTIGCYLHTCRKNESGKIVRNSWKISKDAFEKWLQLPKNAKRQASREGFKESTLKDPGWVPKHLLEHLRLQVQ